MEKSADASVSPQAHCQHLIDGQTSDHGVGSLVQSGQRHDAVARVPAGGRTGAADGSLCAASAGIYEQLVRQALVGPAAG